MKLVPVKWKSKEKLFFNSNDTDTVEMSDVQCLILPPSAICGGANCTAKTLNIYNNKQLV